MDFRKKTLIVRQNYDGVNYIASTQDKFAWKVESEKECGVLHVHTTPENIIPMFANRRSGPGKTVAKEIWRHVMSLAPDTQYISKTTLPVSLYGAEFAFMRIWELPADTVVTKYTRVLSEGSDLFQFKQGNMTLYGELRSALSHFRKLPPLPVFSDKTGAANIASCSSQI